MTYNQKLAIYDEGKLCYNSNTPLPGLVRTPGKALCPYDPSLARKCWLKGYFDAEFKDLWEENK